MVGKRENCVQIKTPRVHTQNIIAGGTLYFSNLQGDRSSLTDRFGVSENDCINTIFPAVTIFPAGSSTTVCTVPQ